MTSNVGSQMIQQISEQSGDEQEMREAVAEALRQHFLPEFLNRIDEIITFKALDREDITKIVDILLNESTT